MQAALDIAAERQKTPTGEAVHVFVHQTGKARELAQQDRHGMAGVVAGFDLFLESPRGLGEVVQCQPAVGREAVTDVAGGIDGAVDIAQQVFRHRFLCIDIDGREIGADGGEQRL
ncbi:conserved hypothetical protein, partial [Ricinus communis]